MGMFDELKEIITTSKEVGVSLSEASQLMKLYASSKDSTPTEVVEDVPEKTEEQDTGKERPEGAQKNENNSQPEDDVIDYKKKVEELEKRLSDLQKENVNKDISEDMPSNDEIINDITRSFM